MEYNPFSLDIHINPYPTYKYLRDQEPLYHNALTLSDGKQLSFWALSRFEDVWDATHDWETFSSSAGPALEMSVQVPMMIAMDPPDHFLNRSIISRAFTPRKINALEPMITQVITDYLDDLQDRDHFDVVEDFSAKFPMDIISLLLGIPQEDRDEVRIRSNISLTRIPGQAEPPPEATAAGAENWAYFSDLIKQRRNKPAHDLMSEIIHAKAQDTNGNHRSLTNEELLGFVMLLAAAGNETVTKFFGNAIYYLNRFPAARTEIAADDAVIPNAVEEILRIDPPSQYQGRIAMCDIEMHGRTIPKGDRVILLTGAACRDEREFETPDELDIHRTINRQLSLGHGRHICLGAHLARMEGYIALREFHQRFPQYDIDEDNLGYVHSGNVRGFTSVPLVIRG